MKLNQTKKTIQRSGGFQEGQFRIAANAHAFDILSSKLYTDVKLAIVRELSTNASDAHMEAGNSDTPFDVHLPNALEPYFSIRDFGTGLSRENLETIYTTYFESTRNDSNEYTGALGLGSKSPFAYTDQFTITSYYHGRKYSYSAFKNENSEPSIALLGESDTDAPNGLEIKISTKSGDHGAFVEAAHKVYRFFNVKPNMSGAVFTDRTCEALIGNSEYELYNDSSHTVGVPGRISLVMGQICYDASGAELAYSITQKLGHYSTLVVFADIGECSIAASREELHYDDKTKKVVNYLVENALKAAKLELEGKVAHCKTKLEKVVAMQQYADILSVSNHSQTISTNSENEYHGKQLQFRSDRLYIDTYASYLRPRKESKYVFIEDDGDEFKQKDRNRIRHWLIENEHHRSGIYLFDIQDRTAFEETFGEATIKLSDLPDPPKKKRAPRVNGVLPRFIKKLKEHSNGCLMGQLEDVATTIDDTDACCIAKKGNYALWDGEEMHPDKVRGIATTCGYTNVYFITSSHFDKMQKELGLPNLETASKDYIEDYVKNISQHQLGRLVHGYDDSYYCNLSTEFLKKLPGLSIECDDIIALSKVQGMNRGHQELIDRFSIKLPKANNYEAIFYKKYPLLDSIRVDSAKLSHAVNYIKMTEELS